MGAPMDDRMTNTMTPTPTCGVLYITYGQKYVRAAMRSAKSVRKNNPAINIHLFVDNESMQVLGLAQNSAPFTSIQVMDNPHRRSKVDMMGRSPFERTLYLDSDTSVAADITAMFGLLDRFDLAAVQAMHRNSSMQEEVWKDKVPNAFPQFNTGVLLYKATPAVFKLFEDWGKAFAESGHRHDQPTFRELVWASGLRVIALPPEYNVRYLKYRFIWSKSEAVPYIYHLKQYHSGWLSWLRDQGKDLAIALADLILWPLYKLTGMRSIQERRVTKRRASKGKPNNL